MAPTPPTATNASAASAAHTKTVQPEEKASDMLKVMKNGLGKLGDVYDQLAKQTAKAAEGGDAETAQHLKKVLDDLETNDTKQEKQVEEVRELLKKTMKTDVVEHLKTVVKTTLKDQIDALVDAQVTEQLQVHMPKELLEEVAGYRRELQDVQRQLHNSESRRANARLRSGRDEELHTIFKADGTISELFPKDLARLFQMDGDTAKALLHEYNEEAAEETPTTPRVDTAAAGGSKHKGRTQSVDINAEPPATPPVNPRIRDRNVNHFMRFCGIQYQLVGSAPNKITVPVETEITGLP